MPTSFARLFDTTRTTTTTTNNNNNIIITTTTTTATTTTTTTTTTTINNATANANTNNTVTDEQLNVQLLVTSVDVLPEALVCIIDIIISISRLAFAS